ncbi:MAG TPA: flagellar basal-body MS-ring/collar protein FliF, partial [Gammaproteobacteria bacterium]|nr:flagellar basal-body MS-ring/collar protein FliF [Gammaproteobacteria bacterium]
MALVKTDDVAAQFRGLGRLSALRQLGMMIGLAASVAIGVWVVMWSQHPSYRVLFSNLNDGDAVKITEELQKDGIKYKVNDNTGTVMVPGDMVHEVRMKLAAQGMPKGSGIGFEMLEKDSGFGTSQFIETARYQRALEGELARTIMALRNVKSARVHLAIPKQPSFIRKRRKPSASVMIVLYPGRSLDDGQVTAIAHLVSSSIPNMDPKQVTVVDQQGHLLTSGDVSPQMTLSSNQFSYRRKLEQYYVQRVEDLLTPITGVGKVRAQVSADLDFTDIEQTKESYDPDSPAIRSEQTSDQKTVGSSAPVGIPGALSNQPPADSQVGSNANAASAGSKSSGKTGQKPQPPVNSTHRSTKNFELNRVISHTRLPSGTVQRLSVAVVVDNLQGVDSDGKPTSHALSQKELDRFTALIKEAVGFNAERGDTVKVINVPFNTPPPPKPLPAPSLMDQPWV